MSRGRSDAQRRTAQEAWPDGYMAAKIQKLELQFQADNRQFEKKSDIFRDVSIHVNGYTQPPADELRRLIGIHGGGYMNYFQRGANHFVICCNLSNAKKADWLRYAVRPDWIVDSIKAGRRLAVADYYLEKQRTVFDFRQEAVQGEATTTTTACETIGDIVIGKGADGPPRPADQRAAHKRAAEEPRTASDVGFVEKFFAKSRLSFIATMKTKMRDYLKTVMENPEHPLNGRQFLRRDDNGARNECLESVFMHIDMDCFFASVATRNRPELKSRPVAVCSNLKAKRKNQDPNIDLTDYRNWSWQDASTAEISCCNYAARQFGIHASMYLGKAQALCPDLVILPYDFEGFEEVSKCLYDTVASLTLNIEAQSVDELYADVTDVIEDTGCSPEDIAKYLKSTIVEKSGCTCTVGMGPNMLIARLATKKAKPDGFCYISQDQVEDFMADKKVDEIPGVGESTEIRLRELGISTCLELQQVPLSELKELVGANQAVRLVELAKGICNRGIKDALTTQRKNISVEINYGMRFKQIDEVINCLGELSNEVHKRLQSANLATEILRLRILVRHPSAPEETMKYLGCGMCDQLTKSETFKMPIASKEMLAKSVRNLYSKLNPVVKDIRGMGITLSKLSSSQNVSKISNIEAFLTGSMKRTDSTAATDQTIEVAGPSTKIEQAENQSPLEVYIFSSSEGSEDEETRTVAPLPVDGSSIRAVGASTAKKTSPVLKKSKKNKLPAKSKGTDAKKTNQLDIRKVLEFGKEAHGECTATSSRESSHKRNALEHSVDLTGNVLARIKSKPSTDNLHETISFGPKKLFHMTCLLQEWLSEAAPDEVDVTAWATCLQRVALANPRACTALLRSMFRLARLCSSGVRSDAWLSVCDRIRSDVQAFVDIKITAGELSVQL